MALEDEAVFSSTKLASMCDIPRNCWNVGRSQYKHQDYKSFELPVCAQCIVGYLRQKSGHQLSKNSHIEILTSDLVLFIKVWIVFSQRSFKLQFFIQAVALLYSSLSPK